MLESIIKFVFPILGISIIAFCALSFLFSYGEGLKGKVQKIKGFGIDLEVSVLTLFIIIGLAFSFTGVYLHIKNYKSQVIDMKAKLQLKEEQLEKMDKMQMTITVQLEGMKQETEPPTADELTCEYFTTNGPEKRSASIMSGFGPGSYRIVLQDVTRKTHVKHLEVVERVPPKRKWVLKNFMPFEPSLRLEKL